MRFQALAEYCICNLQARVTKKYTFSCSVGVSVCVVIEIPYLLYTYILEEKLKMKEQYIFETAIEEIND